MEASGRPPTLLSPVADEDLPTHVLAPSHAPANIQGSRTPILYEEADYREV
jgi:hypothetical protein